MHPAPGSWHPSPTVAARYRARVAASAKYLVEESGIGGEGSWDGRALRQRRSASCRTIALRLEYRGRTKAHARGRPQACGGWSACVVESTLNATMSDTSGDMLTERIPPTAWRAQLLAAAELGLIFAVFFIHGAWRAPEVNETHYLSKARHYWNPDWCARDFFCNTVDAHHVFYWAFGWLSRWLSLPALAWCGRLMCWALLAWSWRRLSVALVPAPLFSVLSAALFVTLNSRCHMAGEWVIGGVEAKVFAYVLVFLGIEALVKNRWGLVWPLLGAATAFHVVVGGWSIVAAALSWLVLGDDKPPLRRMLAPLALGFAV